MPDERSIISPDRLFLTTELQKGVMEGIPLLFNRYVELMGFTDIDPDQWMSREDFTLSLICRGLGWPDMKFSDIINHALVKGGLELAEFQAGMEKELKITESDE